jgi:hypothetical protein
MQRNPVETDFVIEVHPTTIEILFVPTGTWFTFRRFTERKDIIDFGPVSPDARVRWTSRKRDAAPYSAWEVQAIAFRLAFEAASRDDAAK